MQIALERIRAEFTEMPGLQLTHQQVQRLCGVDPMLCKAVLNQLVDAKFLRLHSDGRYTRVGEGDGDRLRPAKAHLIIPRAVREAS